MIRCFADLEEFLANGGRMTFTPRGDRSSWSETESGAEIISTMATRALAERKAVEVERTPDGVVYGKAAA